MTFFNRPVTIMCDFEEGFIKAVEELYASVKVKCCLFHFTQNIVRKAKEIITKTKRAEGNSSPVHKLAQKTKRRLMMMPFLPEEVIKPDVVDLIIAAWKTSAPDGLRDAFDELATTLLQTYTGTHPDDPTSSTPASPRHSGASVE